MNRKGDAVAVIIIIILIIIIIIALVASFAKTAKECEKDTDCGPEHYCGSDFSCHQHKIIEKTVVKNNLTLPAFIIGFFFVVAAVILRKKNIPWLDRLLK